MGAQSAKCAVGRESSWFFRLLTVGKNLSTFPRENWEVEISERVTAR